MAKVKQREYSEFHLCNTKWTFGSSGAVAKATFREFLKDTSGPNQGTQVIGYYKKNSIIFPQRAYVIARKIPQYCKILLKL